MNTFGRQLRLSIFGESHGNGVGVVIDGVPAGLAIPIEDIQADLDARRPGTSILTTQRKEADRAILQTGVRDGHATGAPISIWIANEDMQSKAYRDLARVPRPGHSDWVAGVRSHGYNDPRGGGHYSGRLTAGLVAAGSIADLMLKDAGITVAAHLHQVGELSGPTIPDMAADGLDAAAINQRVAGSQVHTAHDLEEPFAGAIDGARRARDSVGGTVAFTAEGLPVAMGDPFFDSIESMLAHMYFAIPAVRAVEFGAGFGAVAMLGSQHNDPYRWDDGVTVTKNDAGGVLGGLTTGAPLWGHVAFKPTSSIFQSQDSVDLEAGADATLDLTGRHDPCIAIRAVPVVRLATAFVLADFLLLARQQGLAPQWVPEAGR